MLIANGLVEKGDNTEPSNFDYRLDNVRIERARKKEPHANHAFLGISAERFSKCQ
jgi:hypothetical protein